MTNQPNPEDLAGNKLVDSIATGCTQPYDEEPTDGPCIFPSNPNDLAEITKLREELEHSNVGKEALIQACERIKAERDQHAACLREVREKAPREITNWLEANTEYEYQVGDHATILAIIDRRLGEKK